MLAPTTATVAVDQFGEQRFAGVPDLASGVSGFDPACLEEPIHTPGTIQPYGVLLVIDPFLDWTIVAASRNWNKLLDPFSLMSSVLGRSMTSILGKGFAQAAQRHLAGNALYAGAPWRTTRTIAKAAQMFDVAVHNHAGLVLVEMEPVPAKADTDAKEIIRKLQQTIRTLRESGSDLDELALVTAYGIRALTGYERVAIYRFDPNYNGRCIAEDKVADWGRSPGGLSFPAPDIPTQTRELYRRSPMRWVADRDAVPVSLDIDPNRIGTSTSDIDLSFACLRSVSLAHLQIHHDLSINGSMSFSILNQDCLWGLAVCSHRQPHHPSCNQRLATAALVDAFALRIISAEDIVISHNRGKMSPVCRR